MKKVIVMLALAASLVALASCKNAKAPEAEACTEVCTEVCDSCKCAEGACKEACDTCKCCHSCNAETNVVAE